MQLIKNILSKLSSLNTLYYFILFVFSTATFYAMGMRSAVLASVITLFISFLLADRVSKRFFIIYLTVIFFISLFLLPNTITYGSFSFGMTVALIETDIRESYEYLINIPLKNVLISIGYIFLFALLLYIYIHKKNTYKKQPSKTLLIIQLLLFIVGVTYSPIHKYSENYDRDVIELIASSYYSPVNLTLNLYHNVHIYKTEKAKLLNAQDKPATWEILSAQPKYKNYVIIIGESARKDYQSLYGYPIKTSPFMDTVNATIFNNYVAPGAHTVESLNRILLQNDKQNFRYENSVITLANKAGFDTYWLSNQGYLGEYDTSTSIIANKAKHTFFANKADFFSNTFTDLVLLPELKKAITTDTDKPKVIFMHLIGSHSSFCRRIDDSYQVKPITDVINKKLSCYLTSLRQTDKFIESTYHILQNSNTPFSMMYFSDHGQVHREKKNKVSLKHGGNHKQGFDVPMVIMSSDDTDRKYINAKKSGFDFVRQFSQWANIKAKGIDTDKDFFTEYQDDNIQVFDDELKNYDDLADDPALLPE